MALMYSETVDRLRAPLLPDKDRQGNDQYDWDNPDTVTYAHVAVVPVGATETNRSSEPGRDQFTSSYRIFSRPGMDMDVVYTDRIRWQGQVWDVSAVPERWPHPVRRGKVHHVEVDLERVGS